ncbi:MAG: phosphatidylglycerol lysyltransferase [Treponema sp.]|jgi:phosphoglucomutase|nr:phosphatidylglycerol lysyltransferase [Treponema sp.]
MEKNTRVEEALKVLDTMILSASGWRGVFAEAGDEESREPEVSGPHLLVAAAAARVFEAYLEEKNRNARALIVLGFDTRPTGPALAEAMRKSLTCELRFLGVSAAPEIMAYTRFLAEKEGERPIGFIYISASHNPVGHNGIKFGLADGGVIPGTENAKLAGRLAGAVEALCSGEGFPLKPEEIFTPGEMRGEDPGGTAVLKTEALKAYMDFTCIVAGGDPVIETLKEEIKRRPLGIAADFNGSARTCSIDRDFLGQLGIRFRAINDTPGLIVHKIVPEGESLEPCRLFLEECGREDPAFVLGYVPDCDGDRGNMVIRDGEKTRALEAQEVFALSLIAELAHLVYTGELRYDNSGNALDKTAVAVNDPTSLRIDRIARAFDVSVFRAEVGEANVVGLARLLRTQGYKVRILGEGSNGGNITHPAAVRDPLNTILSLVKLLSLRGDGNRQGLFEIWCNLSDQTELYHHDFSLADILASLPAFVTTGAAAPEAQLRVKTGDHGVLKEKYQRIFLRDWEAKKDELKGRYGIAGWEAAAYSGMEEKRRLARFGEAGRGGLKIYFLNSDDFPVASIWMRGSATEPVFRVIADAEGSDPRLERELIEWQRKMVQEAEGV